MRLRNINNGLNILQANANTHHLLNTAFIGGSNRIG
jgi:hypothetical protein